ncbi:Hypothetical predicted protein [Lecanosticta acicola]|uniref:Uncharacterized protein n=1 Tax=Lecanosticta acicola TaxID=111012 RepID=A0AAI8Z6E8_9PEZI|nr:Hypothetical predicted protein [Lecanosticta acicola]
MADRPNHTDGSPKQLPGISSILNTMYPCRQPGCQQAFNNPTKLLYHEQSCDASMLNAPRELPHFAGYRNGQFAPMYPQPHAIRTSFEVPSPPSAMEDTTDSDDSSCAYTPDTSRANSVSLGSERRHSGAIRHEPKYAKSARRSPTQDSVSSTTEKNKKKQEKEKQNRGNQAAVLYRIEDVFRNYCSWERKEQSGGNGNGAGLQANKINVLRGAEDLLYHFLHQERCRAIREGRVDEFEERCTRILNGAGEKQNPLEGTWLYGERDLLCQHADTRSKECTVHHTPDWRECRNLHTMRRFRVEQDRWVKSLL